MPAINFKKEFVPLVESGEKTQTIRQVRKNPIKKGDTLYLYSGLRTNYCRLIKKVECQSIVDIEISDMIRIAGMGITDYKEALEFAREDGFKDLKSFWQIFKNHYKLPFKGVIITW